MSHPDWIDELEVAVKNSLCRSDVLRMLGLSTNGSGNHRTVQHWIDNLKLDTSHFDICKARGRSGGKKIKTEELIFEVNVRLTRAHKLHLKNMFGYKCLICKNDGVHMGIPLTLQLDHIDGNHVNNRIENLRWLCPNCHTQTATYGSKKIKLDEIKKSTINPEWRKYPRLTQRKVCRPTKEELKILIENNSWLAIGKQFGVSDNAVRKWARSYKLLS